MRTGPIRPSAKQQPVPGAASELLQALVTKHWPAAQSRWSSFLLLSNPLFSRAAPGVAQIHLGSRQVTLNDGLIEQHGLQDCVEALLAHEVGHHVRYPGTLAVDARMRMIERTLIPIEGYSLANAFTDLMINAQLGSDYSEQFLRLYTLLVKPHEWQQDPAFFFYLSLYEELWECPGAILREAGTAFHQANPSAATDARLVVNKLFHMEPNIYTQFLYFISMASRYLKPPEENAPRHDPQAGMPCHADAPSADDWADAMTPNAQEKSAVRKAMAEGWIGDADAERIIGSDARKRRITLLPGTACALAEKVPEIMAAWYRREAERFLLSPPPARLLGDALVPTTVEPWQMGDSVKEIDWLQSLLEQGSELAGVSPLKRSRVADTEGYEVPLWRPLIEIYLDASGSMPDPRRHLNAMTLASLILANAAIRKGGWARALIYSTDTIEHWEWCRSETEISQFLMHYYGGGTEFPFARLAASLKDCGPKRPVRVVITDSDFHQNFHDFKDAPGLLSEAASNSSPLILLLHNIQPGTAQPYQSLGAQVIEVKDFDDFPRMAAELARALFPDRRQPRSGG